MDIGTVTDLTREALYTIMITATPLLMISLTVGLAISIFQTVTSIQEQTLTFLPKMLVILVVLALLGGWMFSLMGNYTVNLFSQIKNLAR